MVTDTIALNKKAVKIEEIPLKKLHELSASFVEGTEQGYEILHKIYPVHLYDELRRNIAIDLTGKEIAKILDAESTQELTKHQKAVAELYNGKAGVYTPVHDFWSLVEMALHVKKKELPELITAQNVTWKEEQIPIEQLHITWMPFLEQRQEIFGPKPWNIADLQRIFFQKPDLFKQAQQQQYEVVGEQQHNFDQTNEPIALVYRNGHLELIDGNGRLYRALLGGVDTINCHVGRLKGAMPMNYWISAGAIKQFCLEVRGYAEVDLEGFANGLSYLRTKLRNNTPALINYQLFLRDDFPEFENSLRGILPPKNIAA